MANTIRIKRRGSTGLAGAPSALKNAELAFNEADGVLYYGFGDDGSGNATSINGIAGSGFAVSLTGDQTISGNKTISGDLDLTGAFKINGVTVTASAAEINHLVGVTAGIQGQLDAITTDVSEVRSVVGIADGETSFGTATAAGFSGNTVSDNATVKQALIDLEAAVETTDTDELRSLSGTSEGDTDLGDLGGSILGDTETVKSAIQGLEGAIESANTARAAIETGLIGVTSGDADMGTYGGAGSVLTDGGTIKEALEELEAAIEDGSGTTTADSGSAAYDAGNINLLGGTGLSTSATGSTVTVDLDDTAVSAGSYGAADTVPTYTVDGQGRLTAAADVAISITHEAVSDFDAGVQANTLDSMAQPVAAVAMNSQRITGLADPVGDQDAVTKSYADALVTGLDVKQSVRVATTADITLSGTQTVDGVSLGFGDRVLVKDQSDAKQNGIYDVVDGGAWTRSSDADNTPSGEVTSGMYVFVEQGSANADSGFVLQTTGTITLGTTELSFVQFTGAGQVTAGDGLAKSGNVLSVGGNAGRIVVNANDVDLATHGTAGTYIGFEVDAYGRVTSFSSETTLAGYGITDAQPLDATLTALAGVTTAANELVYATGADSFATTSLTAFGRSFLDDADAAAGRGTLGLGDMATQNASAVAITGGTIDGVVLDGGTF